ncbi:DUF1192 domain-containing protein [Pannonibacter phragmitetus]|uniref:Uncharacterized small protein containing a coiled-coil domain n=1 Tax=Pannonibacter phragmitetus TaxID=121719 RepID=A0A379A0D8_9HYPH|nr:DUF1192 domain-containing protein [Pannonibacter phragmitetus]SUB02560.1 Uncharacterized small protein containing a coiled-coil domain [Pannonibacter phragmitetus]
MSDDNIWAAPKAASAVFVPGSDLSRLSVAELQTEITNLQAEIVRLQREIDARSGVRAAADALFKPSSS